MESNVRNINIDKLKGFLIICVIIGHAKNNIFSDNFDVYLFHIPLFLSCSIIFVKNFNFDLLKNRSLQILLPYIFWTITPPVFTIVYHPINFINNFNLNLKNILMGNWFYLKSILWFLPTLFMTNILHSIFKFLKQRYKPYIITGLYFIISFLTIFFNNWITHFHQLGFIPFGIDIYFYLFPLYIFNEYLFRNKIYLHFFLILAFILISYLCLIYFEPIKNNSGYAHIIDLAQFTVPKTFLMYLCFLILNSSIFLIFLKIKKLNLLAVIGKYSFPIYLLHLIIYESVSKYILSPNRGFLVSNLTFIFILFIIIFFSIIISKLLSRVSFYFKYIGL